MIEGKVWGVNRQLKVSPLVQIYEIEIKPNMQCSLHLHSRKTNGFYCVSGKVEIHTHKKAYDLVDVTTLSPGDFCEIPPGEKHRFVTGDQPAKVLEIYYLEPLEVDIVRDDVGGATKGGRE